MACSEAQPPARPLADLPPPIRFELAGHGGEGGDVGQHLPLAVTEPVFQLIPGDRPTARELEHQGASVQVIAGRGRLMDAGRPGVAPRHQGDPPLYPLQGHLRPL